MSKPRIFTVERESTILSVRALALVLMLAVATQNVAHPIADAATTLVVAAAVAWAFWCTVRDTYQQTRRAVPSITRMTEEDLADALDYLDDHDQGRTERRKLARAVGYWRTVTIPPSDWQPLQTTVTRRRYGYSPEADAAHFGPKDTK